MSEVRAWGEGHEGLTNAVDHLDEIVRLEQALVDSLEFPEVSRRDVHVHLGTDADGHGLTPDDLIVDLDRWGIASAVCFPANEPGADGSFREANRAALDAAARWPQRITPFCRVDPRGEWEGAFEEAVIGGARGLKLHPVAQSFHPESDACIAAVSAATEWDIPVLLHAGFGARRLAEPLVALAKAVPGARLILAHGGRGDARALRDAFTGNHRVAFDTSLAHLPDLVALPPEQVMFGSDRPYGEHGTALHLVSKAAEVAKWSEDQLAGVLGGNIDRWLA